MTRRQGIHIGGICAAALLIAFTLLRPEIPISEDPPAEPRGGPVVTLEEFERIEHGMTYDECVAIIGERGVAFGASTDATEPAPEVEWISIAWRNPDGAYVEISFNFGRVARKKSYDLE